jgi:hypothetical protein
VTKSGNQIGNPATHRASYRTVTLAWGQAAQLAGRHHRPRQLLRGPLQAAQEHVLQLLEQGLDLANGQASH